MSWRWAAMFWCLVILAVPVRAQNEAIAPSPQNSIWFENPVGHAVVGITGSTSSPKISLAYAYYFAAIGPKPAAVNKIYGDCLRKAVIDQGRIFRDEINKWASLFPDESLYSDRLVGHTNDELQAASNRFINTTRDKCLARGQDETVRLNIEGTRLALIKRECTASNCSWMKVPAPVEGAQISEGKRFERAFEAAYYWTLKNGLDRGTNQVVLLDFPTGGKTVPRIIEVRSDPSIAWPALVSPNAKLAALESSVARVQASSGQWRLSPVITAQIALPRATVLRVANAFSDPQGAYDLGSDATAVALLKVQDEVARIRLYECANYRDSGPVSEIAACAGYQVDNKQLLDCLNGAACMPTIAATADAGALLLAARRSVKELSLDAMIPRPFSEAANSFGKVVDDYKACAVENTVEDRIKECVARQQIPEAVRNQANCLLSGTTVDRLGCVLPQGDARKALDRFQACESGGGKNCAVVAALPAEVVCVGNAKDNTAALACAAPGSVGDVVAATQCLRNAGGDYVAKIRCVAGNNIPPQVAGVLDCYASGTSEAAIAVCALGKNLPPEQALIVQCAAQSGGNVLGAGVCMASPMLKLNPGQQILLQCAMSSGGVPVTFAACAVGQFTFQELQGCKKKDFGESGCFGQGNEFQKLAKALTGKTISKSSVVGQITVFHINTANAALSGVGHALSQVKNGLQNTGEGFNHEVEKIRTKPIEAFAAAPGNILREGSKGIGNIGEAIGDEVKKRWRKPFG